eukprot:comp12199_c0_seq1/m.6963 comp12199_c0_seq1/g.6963  ORF comp12199_c0_seq1/g.6963 comp12199_c0_seq1/m.6963 type:complete len:316 (-) comp12199_c0_seq1:521-1468(-)
MSPTEKSFARARPRVVFSDLDGTLVHYPKDCESFSVLEPAKEGVKTRTVRYTHGPYAGQVRECVELPSLTGGPSYLSLKTIELIAEVRRKGCAFVIITGARSTTLYNRLPDLPICDFYVWENGGKIASEDHTLDREWESTMEPITGKDQGEIPEPTNRVGPLWDAYREMNERGWVLDARGYSTAFRVDLKRTPGKSLQDFEKDRAYLCAKYGFASSYNIGKADFYPPYSGKDNAAKYLAKKLGVTSREEIVAIFDDDNDILLGKEAGWALLPGTTHENVLEALRMQPRWHLTEAQGVIGAEEALQTILAAIKMYS